MIIYVITNKINGKQYVGETTKSLNERFNQHINMKASYKQRKSAISAAIKKYGKENFIIEQVDTASTVEELSLKEQEWIKKLGTFQKGYNLTTGGAGTKDRKYSEETKKKISDKAKIRMQNPKNREHAAIKTKEYFESHPEAKEYLRKLNLGKKPSLESIRKNADAQRGKKKHTPESKEAIAASRIGKPMSEESKIKISNTKKENYNPLTNPMNDPIKREKVRQSKIGKRKFYRTDGSSFMSDPQNPIDPRTNPKYRY